MNASDAVKLFGLNNLLIETEIQGLQKALDVDLGHLGRSASEAEKAFYPQFPERLRREADSMARHYALFYCLENSIREMVVARMEDIHGADWWKLAVPEPIRNNVEKNYRREMASGVTMRSQALIDYTNFGELGEIIKANFETFGDTLRDVSAVQKILASLNTLRAPIAHCKALAEDEVLRLRLSLADWFRQMS